MTAANYGIKPLPNLETRFVAADTLLALDRPPQRTLGQTDAVTRLERAIAANRERHFHASARPDKLQCRRADTRLRRQLAQELRAAGFPRRLRRPNRPMGTLRPKRPRRPLVRPRVYVRRRQRVRHCNWKPALCAVAERRRTVGRSVQRRRVYNIRPNRRRVPVILRKGLSIAEVGKGLLAYITSNSWLKAEYGKSTRRYFAERNTPIRLLEMGKDVFDPSHR